MLSIIEFLYSTAMASYSFMNLRTSAQLKKEAAYLLSVSVLEDLEPQLEIRQKESRLLFW